MQLIMPPLTSLDVLGLDCLRGNFVARVTVAPVDLWILLSNTMMEHLLSTICRAIRTPRRPENNSPHLPAGPPIPLFSTLMLVTRRTLVSRMDYDPPAWHALFVTRRQCKNPRSSRIFFPDGISSSKLDLWTRTSPPSDHKALDVPVIQQWKRFNVINDD